MGDVCDIRGALESRGRESLGEELLRRGRGGGSTDKGLKRTTVSYGVEGIEAMRGGKGEGRKRKGKLKSHPGQ